MSVSPTATYPASRWIARSQGRMKRWKNAARARSAIPLLAPGIAAVVVAARLPIPRLVLRDEADAGEPLGALPEVEIGEERAHRRPVRTRDRVAVEAVRDERVRLERLAQRH